jgi:hypothetical protein
LAKTYIRYVSCVGVDVGRGRVEQTAEAYGIGKKGACELGRESIGGGEW